MAVKPLPPQDTLLQLLQYDPETGVLTWKERSVDLFPSDGSQPQASFAATWNKKNSGKQIRSAMSVGYIGAAIFGEHFLAHRFVFKMVTGRDPEWIDHINGDRKDNRWGNLREVSRIENNQNMALRASSESGHHGVTRTGPTHMWRVRITVKKQVIKLGFFKNLEDAIAARKQAEAIYGFHPNHGRSLI